MTNRKSSGNLQLTIGFSSHRPETLPEAERLMAAHDVIVVEEPPTPDFDGMLTGKLSMQAYLLNADVEYPIFAEASGRMLQRMQAVGKRIYPCEPFLGGLIQIHEHLSDGHGPETLAADDHLWSIYLAEREATGRLLAFYRAAARADFDAMVKTACEFALADAARFTLRDKLRASAIASLLAELEGRIYIEAGYLHLRLLRELKRRLSPSATVRPRYLLQSVYRTTGRRGHLYNPGDLLTLALIFEHPPEMKRQRLLAARSMIYNQLVSMEEEPPGDGDFPDAVEDIQVIQRVNRLTLDDCRRLHGQFQITKSLAGRRKLVNLPETLAR